MMRARLRPTRLRRQALVVVRPVFASSSSASSSSKGITPAEPPGPPADGASSGAAAGASSSSADAPTSAPVMAPRRFAFEVTNMSEEQAQSYAPPGARITKDTVKHMRWKGWLPKKPTNPRYVTKTWGLLHGIERPAGIALRAGGHMGSVQELQSRRGVPMDLHAFASLVIRCQQRHPLK